MIKKIRIQEKNIPVPVPLKNLAAAMVWVRETFIKDDSAITRVKLDGEDLTGENEDHWDEIELNEVSQLVINLETPRDLSISAIEATKELAQAAESTFQKLAIELWQEDIAYPQSKVYDLIQDLGLVTNLVEHLGGILEYSHKDMAPVLALGKLLHRAKIRLEKSVLCKDRKKNAKMLITQIGPLLHELSIECENLEIRVLSLEQKSINVPMHP